jgi:hypothetical protein
MWAQSSATSVPQTFRPVLLFSDPSSAVPNYAIFLPASRNLTHEQTKSTYLTEPIDVYTDWIDACADENEENDDGDK